jgi:TetR/AcrR family transcriptional regulator, cholesterol catabolism regulator
MKSRPTAAPDASAAKNVVVLETFAKGKRKTHRRSGEIIDAAARVFAELGYHGATTQDIADVLRIRQASLYYYFPSKEIALEMVCMRGMEGFFETAQAIATGPGKPSERLAGLVRAHISPLLDRGDFVKVFQTQRQFLPTASRRRVGKLSRGLERIFQGVIREGMRKGEFRPDLDARLTTLAILGMANAVASWYGKEKAPVERIANEFVAFTLGGISRRPKTRSALR